MTNKKILVAVVSLVLVAALSLLLSQGQGGSKDKLVGTALWDGKVSAEVGDISIQQQDQALVFQRNTAGAWLIIPKEGEAFPASAQKIVELYDQLKKSKIIRRVSTKEDTWERLDLTDETAQTLQLKVADKSHLEILLGKERQGGGQYMRYQGGTESYLLDHKISLDLDEKSWELQTLVKLDPNQIKSVRFGKKASFTLTRPDHSQTFQLSDLADTEELNATKLGSLSSILRNFDIKERSLRSQQNQESGNPDVVVECFSGDVYSIWVNKLVGQKPEDDRYFAHVVMKSASPESKVRAANLNEISQKWRLEVDKSLAEKFLSTRSDFVKKKAS